MQEHTSVLLKESIDSLNLAPRAVAIDCTVGQGGHSLEIATRVGKGGTVLALDADESSLERAKERLQGVAAHLIFMHGNFKSIKEHAARAGISFADAIIFDLGWHSGQLMSGRGFSFKEDAPLLMTLNKNPEAYQVTAADIIGNWHEDDLATLFREMGGERFAGRIARVIVEERSKTPIVNALQLAEIVRDAVPKAFKNHRIHPATKVFQALRIAVNDELGSLEVGLTAAIELLASKGRLAVITFHSLEDRIVKQKFKSAEAEGLGRVITKKPVVPSRAEQKSNARARSAKLRIFEKHD